ncbi:MAG: hypothetical protein HZB16_22865 [Armatimonadetes bacterium]|nr:hypothetical protein [Armatimonadota bacterium]
MKGRCFFPAIHGCLVFVRFVGALLVGELLFPLLMVIADGTAPNTPPSSTVAGLSALFLFLALPYCWRAGLAVDSAGFSERWPLGWRRRTRWDRVVDVELGDKTAVLVTQDRRLALHGWLIEWRDAALLCQRWLARTSGLDPDAADLDHPETVAQWLDLAPGAAIELRSNGSVGGLLFAALFCLMPLVFALAFALPEALGILPAVLLVLAVAVVARFATVVTRARVDASGIQLRTLTGWHAVSWSSLVSASSPVSIEDAVLQTEDGRFRLPVNLEPREQFLAAANRAIEARRGGAVLPRLTDSAEVPDGAISLTGAGHAAAERGISLVEGQDPS